jgi:hypothetical protein
MEIDYDLEKDDLVAFYCFHNLTSQEARKNHEKWDNTVRYVTIILVTLPIAYFFAQSWGEEHFGFSVFP